MSDERVEDHAPPPTAEAPAGAGTYISGGRIDQLVNIANANAVNLSGPVTLSVDASQVLHHLGIEPTPSPVGPGVLERASFEPETVYIPGGPFLMGSDGGDGVYEYEKPRHELSLPAFRMGRYPITNAQFLEYVRATRVAVAGQMGWVLARVGQEPPAGMGEHPVVGISWDDALAYCRWLSEQSRRPYRLPSEAEWEKAGGGTDGRRYPWGDVFDRSCCNSVEAGMAALTAVAAHAPQGDSVYGCSDMAGNAWEWTSTIWGAQRGYPEFGPPYRPDDGRERLEPFATYRELRIRRGGSFQERAERVACTARGRLMANTRDANHGFRVAMSV